MNGFKNFFRREKTYTEEQVKQLLEQIKRFNAGAIDRHLDEWINVCYKEWKDKE